MELPKLRSVNIKEITIQKQKVKLQAWSNRNMIQYDSVKESIEEDQILSEEEKRYKIEDAIFEYLIKPNYTCDVDIRLSTMDQKKVFVELYKLSRGTQIEGRFQCGYCYDESDPKTSRFVFDIDRDYKFHELSKKQIDIDGITFNLKESTFVRSDYDSDDDLGVRYLLSYIKSFRVDSKLYNGLKDTEIYDWVMNELPEVQFNKLIIELQNTVATIEISVDVTCEYCKKQSVLEFQDLPDFSIVMP